MEPQEVVETVRNARAETVVGELDFESEVSLHEGFVELQNT